MKKRVASVISMLIVIGMMTGCKNNKLPVDFNEDEVKSAAEEVVELINADDFETVINEKSDERLKDNLTVDNLKSGKKKIMENAGDFQSFISKTVMGEYDKSTDQDFAVVVVIAQYENQKVTYTISFNKDMELIGIYLK